MKIGVVINSAWNIYNFRRGLVCALLENEHQVVAIAPEDGYGKRLREMGCDFVPLRMGNKSTNPFSDLQLIYRLYRIYQEQDLDVVLHYTIKPNIYGTLAAKILGIPTINNVTGLGTVFIRKGLSSKIAHLLYRISFRFPDVVFFQNGDDKQLFLEKKLVKAEKTEILPGSGIDTQYFRPTWVQNPLPTQKREPFKFLMVARLLYDKGILEYIEAIRLLRDKGIHAKFQLLGKIETSKGLGISEKELDKWQKEGLIEYLGAVEDVRPIMAQADCVVLPSYREGTPRTLLEAASLGKPLIATDVPGCRETIDDGLNGFLCEVKNAYDLADKMQKLLSLPAEAREQMGKQSRKLVEMRFDQKIVIEKYQQALQIITLQ
ncbi:glycosyltransferase family 4 protein [Hugenholtzia roseola]|uniref:glycosyltransferase family 4 protein n=1 Tax=Hugenholtzia roseola TaxID=1002 RepID=UPI00047BE231|nr:glycosyltransferase family 4 protein [Hugenholtzia roseola]